MLLKQFCGSEERRQKVGASTKTIAGLRLNGIDFIEVLDEDAPAPELRQKLIDVTFLRVDGLFQNGRSCRKRTNSPSRAGCASAASRCSRSRPAERSHPAPDARPATATISRATGSSSPTGRPTNRPRISTTRSPSWNFPSRRIARPLSIACRFPPPPAGERPGARLSREGLRELPPDDARPHGRHHSDLDRAQPRSRRHAG